MMNLGVKAGLNEIPGCKHCVLGLWLYEKEGDKWKKKVVELPICTHSSTLSIWPSLFLFGASPGGCCHSMPAPRGTGRGRAAAGLRLRLRARV